MVICPRGAVEFFGEVDPAIDVVVLQGCFLSSELGKVLRESGFKHEGHGVAQALWLQLGAGGGLEGGFVGAVREHHVVQADTAGDEALGLGIVNAVDVAHELGHDVFMVPGRAEGVFGD